MNAPSKFVQEDLISLKGRLELIEGSIDAQMKDLETRQEKWNLMEAHVSEVLESQTGIVHLNIGGVRFSTRLSTLTKVEGTLFDRMVTAQKIKASDEIFFDRSPNIFPYVLDYLRNGEILYQKLNREELEELKLEADYYELSEISAYLNDNLKDIEFVNMEFSGPYRSGNQTAGTNQLEDLLTSDLTKGVCATSPGWILVELNREWEFQEIEIAGYSGNNYLWYVANGSGASIQTSRDKKQWTVVGMIPNNLGSQIQTVALIKTTARYIKFTHSSLLGLGYLKIKKI